MNKTENEFMLQVKWHGVNETPEISSTQATYDDEREEYFYHDNDALNLVVKDKETGAVHMWKSYSACMLTYGKFEGKDDSSGFYQVLSNENYGTTTVELINDDRYEVVAWSFAPVIGIEPYKEEEILVIDIDDPEDHKKGIHKYL